MFLPPCVTWDVTAGAARSEGGQDADDGSGRRGEENGEGRWQRGNMCGNC